MWRVPGLVGRVLGRYHGGTPLRLSQNHHVEDDLVSSSSRLSTSLQPPENSSQKGGDGERKKKKTTSQFCFAGLPRYTVLDAVGWGAAAVLVMQIVKRVHSTLSSGSERSPKAPSGHLAVRSTLHKCGYRILLEILSRQDVLPRGRNVLCLQGAKEAQNQHQSTSDTDSSDASLDSEENHLSDDSSFSDHQRAGQSRDSHVPEESLHLASSPPEHRPAERDSRQTTTDNEPKVLYEEEEKLIGAALNLRHVADSSVPVILNIIGLETSKSGDYEMAFSCFLASAKHGYNKAQFNTGVCFETGRGVRKDKEKALHFYREAASGGHRLAQYRCAKLLLARRGQQSTEDLDTAVDLLEQAAAAGLTEAQVYLASVFSQEPVRDERKSINYLQMAAERGDSTALLFLGQCYESGFGVPQSLGVALRFYRQAAQAGNSQARRLLGPPCGAEDGVLRSIRSAPCFSATDRLRHLSSSPANPVPSFAASRLVPSPPPPPSVPSMPHSWSTGSLGSPVSSMPLHLHAQGPVGRPCQWTIGVG